MSLSVNNIHHRFGRSGVSRSKIDQPAVVNDASLNVASGEIVCLFGPSGCGKTTLLRIIAGHEAVQAGQIVLNGETLADPQGSRPPEARPIGFVFQDFALFPHLSVRGNIGFGLSGGQQKNDIDDHLRAMGLEGLGNRYPNQLSGGQQQRVALARALIRKPAAMLLDEPFASIDLVLRRRLREQMRATLKEAGAPTIIVTHDPEEALALGDRIALMREGVIVEINTPEDLYTDPQTADGANLFPGGQVVAGEVSAGVFESAFGAIEFHQKKSQSFRDGPAIAVLRKGAAMISSTSTGEELAVVDHRFSGPGYDTLVANNQGERLWAQGDQRFDIGDHVHLCFAPEKVFVFPVAS